MSTSRTLNLKSATNNLYYLENKWLQLVVKWILREYRRCAGEPTSKVGPTDIDYFNDKMLKLQSRMGKEFTVKTIKLVRNYVTRYISGNPVHVSENRIGLHKNGLPKCLGPLIPIITKKNPEDLRKVMTLLSVSRLDLGDGSLDASSITNNFHGDYDKLSEYTFSCKIVLNNLRQLKWLRFPGQDETLWDKFHLTTKTGPNGHALGQSLTDLSVIPDSLIDDIKIFGGEKISKIIDVMRPVTKALYTDEDSIFRKISVIQDKELKNRPIAIFDYWSQTVLKKLHDSLMETLKTVSTDLTFNQDGCKEIWNLRKEGNCFHSFDLSSATDRFPAILQSGVLESLLGKERAEAWLRIMTQWEFHHKGLTYKYNVGQPMGGYSSWAMFSLCHHLIVQVASRDSQTTNIWQPFEDYRILGDDIVIWNDSVAKKYEAIMFDLGVEISKTKTHVSKDTYEMAKRWFIQGQEFSPYPLNALIEHKSNPYFLGQTFYDVLRKGWESSTNQSIPGRMVGIRDLLRIFGYNKRSIERCYPKIKDSFLFYHFIENEHNPSGSRSIQEFVRRHGSDMSFPDSKSIYKELSLIIRLMKTKGLQSILDKAEIVPLDAEVIQDTIKSTISDCGLPLPDQLDEYIPLVAVLNGVREQCTAMLWTVDRYAQEMDIREVLQLGTDLVVPDPNVVETTRKSRMILTRSNKLLSSLVKILEEDSSSFLEEIPQLEEYLETFKTEGVGIDGLY